MIKEVKEIVKIDNESFARLKDMFSSPDQENHTVGFSVLKNLNYKENLPYILLLYRLYYKTSDQWKDVLEKINKTLKSLKFPEAENVNYNTIYNIIEQHYPDKLTVILDQFSDVMKERLIKWKFPFLEKHKMFVK